MSGKLIADVQRMLNDIIAKVPGFVFWKDTDLKLMGCNENFARQVGYRSTAGYCGLNRS